MSGTWIEQLQPASWRGIYFAVLESEIRRGRRVAVHEYPYRDVVWVEDLGLGTRRYSFRGFYVGDDCYQQEEAMLAAAETGGPGTLVHPSLGQLQVNLVEFSSAQRADRGRVVEYSLSFIEGSPGSLFPSTGSNTQAQASSAADDADSATSGDFFDAVQDALTQGAAVINEAAGTAHAFVSEATGLVNTGARLVNSINGLGPLLANTSYSLGRYSGGSIIPGPAAPISGIIAAVQAAGGSPIGQVVSAASMATSNAIAAGQTVVAAGEQVASLAEAL